MPGYVGHELQRCLEFSDRYVLLVRWRSVEDHEVGFRPSRWYLEWKRLLHHFFYDPFPVVEHFDLVEPQRASGRRAPTDRHRWWLCRIDPETIRLVFGGGERQAPDSTNVVITMFVTYNATRSYTSGGMAVNTKLTLRLDDQLIDKAKRYSDRSGKSVSQLVADFFAAIDSNEDIPGTQISPRVRSLRGAFKGSSATEEDHRSYLEEKYR